MKIAFFSDSYRPYISGVVNSIDTFKGELESRGHQVFIFAPDYPNAGSEPGVFRFSSIPAFTNPGFRVAIPFSLSVTSQVEELGIDIIHTHSPFNMGILGAHIAEKLNLPLAFTYHTLYEEYAHYAPILEGVARKIAIKISKDYCENCDLVITPTAEIKERLHKYGTRNTIIPIPTGIPMKRYLEADRNWLSRNYPHLQGKTVILYLGRLGKEKNIYILWNIFRELQQQYQDLHLLLVGGGPEEENIRKQVIKLGLRDKVTMTGYVEPEEVVNYYSGADIFAFPSETETQGLVVLEAMAASLPVVAMDAQGPRDFLADTGAGLLAEPNASSFAERLKQLIEMGPAARSVMGEEARQIASEYSSGRMAERLIDSYNDLIALPKKGYYEDKQKSSLGMN
ncbi:MAG: glycosyltransferase family 4 protein [Halanaerobium sp.]|nr:glycosyltransferase family 4 protein [Halanaerobium sp.]